MNCIILKHKKYIEVKKDLVDAFNQLKDIDKDMLADASKYDWLINYVNDLEDILYIIKRSIDTLNEVNDEKRVNIG